MRERPRLAPVDLSDPPGAPDQDTGVLERISDSLAREVYRRKAELGVEREPFTAVMVEDDDGRWDR